MSKQQVKGYKVGPKRRGEKGQYHGHHWVPDIPAIPDADRLMPDTAYSIYDHPKMRKKLLKSS